MRVEWLDGVPESKAFNEVGLFGNQNTVCQPKTPKWRHTVEPLKTAFPKWEGSVAAGDLSLRKPDLDPSRDSRRPPEFARRGPVDLQDYRRWMRVQHGLHARHGAHEVVRELGVRRPAHHQDQRHLEALHRGQFVGHVADAAVVCDGHAPVGSAMLQPLLVAAIGREQVAVTLHLEAGVGQDAWKLRFFRTICGWRSTVSSLEDELSTAAVGRFVASAGLPAAVDSRAEAVCARGGRREIGYTPRVGTVAAWALLPALRCLSAATSWGLNSGARLRVHAGAQGR